MIVKRNTKTSQFSRLVRKYGRGNIIVAAVFVLAFACMGIRTIVKSHAATGYVEICSEHNYCLNDWNNGSNVFMYKSGANNNAYYLQNVDRCSKSNNLTTNNCPAQGVAAGVPIYQIRDIRKANACVGITYSDWAQEVPCNNTSYPGTGGGTGTIVLKYSYACPANYYALVDSHYWGNKYGGDNVRGPDANGYPATMDYGSAWCFTSKSF